MSALGASAAATVGETGNLAVAVSREPPIAIGQIAQTNAADSSSALVNGIVESSRQESGDGEAPSFAANEFRLRNPLSADEQSRVLTSAEQFLQENQLLGARLLEEPADQLDFDAEEFLREQSQTISDLVDQFEAVLERIDRIVAQSQELAEEFTARPTEQPSPSLNNLFSSADRLMEELAQRAQDFTSVSAAAANVLRSESLTSSLRPSINAVF